MENVNMYLVTGGDGFIGSHIAETLLKQNQKVRVFDNMSARNGENVVMLEKLYGENFQVFEGDLRNEDDCAKAMKDVDYVFHLAALGSIPRSIDNPLRTHHVNATGTLNMLDAARLNKVKRFVHSSSSSVYGKQEGDGIVLRENAPTVPMSPYGVSKTAAEHYVRVFYEIYGLPTVALRYFNVFGPRQSPEGAYAAVIPRFVEAALNGKAPIVFGDGQQSRDFTYIQNVVEANISATKSQKAVGNVINTAIGENHSVLEIIEHLEKYLGKSITPEFKEARPGEVRHTIADITKAKSLLNYNPKIRFAEGMAKTIQAMQA